MNTKVLNEGLKIKPKLTVTIASFVCAISEMIPSVNISSTKYLKWNKTDFRE